MYIVPVHVFLSVCICSAIRSGFEFSTGDTGDDDLAPNCAEGKQDPQDHNVFILDPQDARDLNLLQPWCLREDNACQGPKVCQVAVTPRIDPWEPINGSELLITILANCTTSGQLFLCPERSSRPGCAASLQLPGLPTRPRHLFRFIISKPRMQVLDHRRFVFDEVLEAVLVVELVSTACALVWLVSEMLFMHSVNHLGDVCEEYDKRLQMPGAFEVMCEGLLDATCFVFGCILYLGACSQFLHKYGSQSQNVDTLILCIPAIFGPCSLLRIFLSISRRQLYYTLYRRGILLVFEKVPMWKDLLLIWSMMGSVLAVVAVLSGLGLAVSMNQVSKRDMLTQLLVFTSPLYTMVSSFQWEMDAETHCAQRRCVLELDEQSPGEEQAVTTSHKLRVVSERSFCAAARSAHSITECLERKMDLCESSGPAFGPRDMMWANHFLCQTSSKHRLSLVVFMPLLLLCILSLAMGSTVLAIKHRSDVPQLLSLEPSLGRALPTASPEIRNHVIYVDIMRRALSIESEGDPIQTTSLRAEVVGEIQKRNARQRSSSNLVQTTGVNLQQAGDTYPTTIRLTASTRVEEEKYEVQIFQVTSLVRSVMLKGKTESGRPFDRCVGGNHLIHGNIALPPDLKSLQLEVATLNIPYEMPREASLPDRFSTVFLPKNVTGDCERYCFQHKKCYESKVRSSAGCFFIFGPGKARCREIHKSQRQQGAAYQVLNKLHLGAELCLSSGKQARNLQGCLKLDEGKGVLVSQVLDVKNFSISQVALKTHIDSSGSVFDLERSSMHLYNGTPPVKTILVRAQDTDMDVATEVVVLDEGFNFEVKLLYNPTSTNFPWNRSRFHLSLSAIVEDPAFVFEWEDSNDLLPALAGKESKRYPQCDDEFELNSYQSCGGFFASPEVRYRVDAWAPKALLRGKIRYKMGKKQGELYEAVDVNVTITTSDGLEPLQRLVRTNCSVPLCLGGFDECMRTSGTSAVTQVHTCSRDAHMQCQKLLTAGEKFVAMMAEPETYRKLSNKYIATASHPTPGMEKYFTWPVIEDIAAHCDLHSGLLAMVADQLVEMQERPQKAQAIEIFKKLIFNPDFNGSKPLRDDSLLLLFKNDLPTHYMSLQELVLYSPDIAQLQFAFCSSVSPWNVSSTLLSSVVDRVATTAFSNEKQQQRNWQLVLSSLIRCANRVRRNIARRTVGCLRTPKAPPPLYDLAPDETTFEILLPYCNISKPLDREGGTLLHLAAQKGWHHALEGMLKAKDSPKVDAVRNDNMVKEQQVGDDLERGNLHMTALHDACQAASPKSTKLLLSHGASVDPLAEIGVNVTTLGVPINRGDLAHHRAAVLNMTPLHFACETKCADCVDYLISHHAQVNAEAVLISQEFSFVSGSRELVEDERRTCTLRPLDLAVYYNCNKCVEALIRAGAKTDQVTTPAYRGWAPMAMRYVANATQNECAIWCLDNKFPPLMESVSAISSRQYVNRR